MAAETFSHFKFYNRGGKCGCSNFIIKLFWTALDRIWAPEHECTGKSPDPLYLRACDAIQIVL